MALAPTRSSANILAGLGGNDHLKGMGGNDILVGGLGADILDGGTGIDTANYSTSAAPVNLVLGGVSSGGDAAGDTFISIEKFVGTAGADVIDGSASTTGFSVDGGGGGDSITGGQGDDQLSLGGSAALALAGFQALAEEGGEADGGAGDDTLNGNDDDNNLSGGADDDTLNGGGGNDNLDGGTGHNVVHGGTGNDNITVGPDSSEYFGDEDDDILVFSDGTFAGGSPDVLIDLGTMDGGEGNNKLDLSNVSQPTIITLGDDDITNITLPDTEALLAMSGSQAVALAGGRNYRFGQPHDDDFVLPSQDDQFTGNAANNTVEGGAGNDRINGGGGNDRIYGRNQPHDDFFALAAEDDNDTLDGADGDDLVDGGPGADVLSGGSGADMFVWSEGDLDPNAIDAITDFEAGDMIDLSKIDADPNQDGNQAFTFSVYGGDGLVQVDNGYVFISTTTEFLGYINLNGSPLIAPDEQSFVL